MQDTELREQLLAVFIPFALMQRVLNGVALSQGMLNDYHQNLCGEFDDNLDLAPFRPLGFSSKGSVQLNHIFRPAKLIVQ